MTTQITLERGVLFFEDGAEVADVSLEMLFAAPDTRKLLWSAVALLKSLRDGEFSDGDWLSVDEVIDDTETLIGPVE
jgi:hypothetical protein